VISDSIASPQNKLEISYYKAYDPPGKGFYRVYVVYILGNIVGISAGKLEPHRRRIAKNFIACDE
jgi:hypothetical protein